jgi:uncharacterized repeat protein (TIGR03847 family)
MTRRLFIFDSPDRFVTGTVGEPGQRTFFLQARSESRVVSVVLEKVQVALLADRLLALLDEIGRRGGGEIDTTTADLEPLDEPLNEAFRAGTLTIGWDPTAEKIVIEAREQIETEEDEDEEDEPEVMLDADVDGPDLVRVSIDPGDARGFVERAARVLASGRPPCPLCGQPLDPQGHLCPRRNGNYVN